MKDGLIEMERSLRKQEKWSDQGWADAAKGRGQDMTRVSARLEARATV